jgi:hypothetical protein
MAEVTRTASKAKFQTGDIPTENDFIDLHDSVVFVDESHRGINSQTGTSYTLVLTDANKIVEMNNASANTVTVPPNSSVAFGTKAVIQICQMGAGETTIVAGSGVTIRSFEDNLAVGGQYRSVTLHKRGTNEWVLTGAVAASADVTPPTVVSATAINSTTIRVVFSEVVTATNVGWSFKKNGGAHNPTGISGSGTNTLDFTVPSMIGTDTILRSYNSTTGNTIDAARNELVTFTDQAVTNSITDTTPPTLSSITVENGSEDEIWMNFNEAMDQTSTPAAADFAVDVNGSPATVSGASWLSSTRLAVVMATPITSGQTVVLDYTLGTNRIQDVAGNDLAALTNQAVTNNVSGTDADVQTWATNSGVVDSTYIGHLSTFVTALKNASIWATHFDFIHVLMGGTLDKVKRNLINPLDTDASFRLDFVNGGTYASTGATLNGTNQYIDAFYNPGSGTKKIGATDSHIAIYQRTSAGVAGVGWGVIDTPSQMYLNPRFTDGNYTLRYTDFGDNSGAVASGKGFYIAQSNGTTVTLHKDGTQLESEPDNGSGEGLPALKLTFGALNLNGTVGTFRATELCILSAGKRFDATQRAAYETAVANLATALGL